MFLTITNYMSDWLVEGRGYITFQGDPFCRFSCMHQVHSIFTSISHLLKLFCIRHTSFCIDSNESPPNNWIFNVLLKN